VITPRLQRCGYCGEELGVFAHSMTRDGPLSCSDPKCSREAARDERDAEMAELEDARSRAAEDDYARYR
jgi:hypothetical protein